MGQAVRTSILISLFFCLLPTQIFCEPLVIEKPHVREPLHMALVYEDMGMQPTALEIKKLLISTGLFDIKVSQGSVPVSKQEITSFMHKGFSVVLFMQQSAQQHIAFRLYDATDATMLLGKNIGSSFGRMDSTALTTSGSGNQQN